MTTPNFGVFAHGGSENCNHGPIRCACLDLATGEVLFDEEYAKKKRPEMEHGTCTDAATISILSAVIVCKRKKIKPVIWCKDPYAIERARNFMEWARTEQPPSDGYEERDWHPMILQAMAALTFDTSDVELHKWDKHKHGDNPLARGRYG
jgi:hypothetical protein